jgi:putative Holliday junction resolvase
MAATSTPSAYLMALDVGTVRVGVALASSIARLPRPFATLQNDESLWASLQEICATENIGLVVIGLPRGLDGQETSQTAYCREFAEKAKFTLGLEIALQDEALTSVKASAELASAQKSHSKEDIDALAATYILEDYLQEHTS